MNTILSAILVLSALAQSPKSPVAEKLVAEAQELATASREPAEKALQNAKKLATRENVASFGFDTLEEVQKAKLGQPLPVIIVRLDELRAFKPGDDPYKLLHVVPKVMYCVNADGVIRCALEVDRTDNQWEASAFGVDGPAREHVEAIKAEAAKEGATSFYLVKILALNRTYLAYASAKGPRMIAIESDSEENAVTKSLPAREVFSALVAEAKEHDGGMR